MNDEHEMPPLFQRPTIRGILGYTVKIAVGAPVAAIGLVLVAWGAEWLCHWLESLWAWLPMP